MAKRASKARRQQIVDILNREWDPIGVVPDGILDEYDSYVGKLMTLLRQEATDREIADYLVWAQTVDMGMSKPISQIQALRIVAALRGAGDER